MHIILRSLKDLFHQCNEVIQERTTQRSQKTGNQSQGKEKGQARTMEKDGSYTAHLESKSSDKKDFFFPHTHSTWKFPGQGSNPYHSSDLSCCSDNTRSLTSCAIKEFQKFRLEQRANGTKRGKKIGYLISLIVLREMLQLWRKICKLINKWWGLTEY